MKTYNINLSISGHTQTLNLLYNIMSLDVEGVDFINLTMPSFKKIYKDKPHIASQMEAGQCWVRNIYYGDSTVELNLESVTPVPSGFLHAFADSFGVPFTVNTYDEGGNEFIIYYNKGVKYLEGNT